MRHAQILAHREVRSEILERLRDLEIMEIRSEKDLPEGVSSERAWDTSAYGDELNKISFIRTYLERYNKIQKGFIDMFTGAKPEIEEKNFLDLIAKFDLDALYERAKRNEARLGEIEDQKDAVSQRIASLGPWSNLDLAVGAIGPTEYTESFLVTFKSGSWENALEKIEGLPVYHEIVNEEASYIRAFFIVFKDEKFNFRDFVAQNDGVLESFQEEEDLSPEKILESLRESVQVLEKEKETIITEDSDLAMSLVDILGVLDYYLDKRNLWEVGADIPKTKNVLVIEGWVREKDAKALESAIGGMEKVALSLRDPLPGEDVPIYLENHPIIRPFEVITNIFGYPTYDEIDPTPVLAPFFWVFFGMTLGDAVYGLALTFGSMLFLKKQRLAGGGDKLVRLLMYSGISTFLYGVLTGSWMADLSTIFLPGSAIDRIITGLAILDPIDDPLTIMMLSLVLGVIHIWVGIAVKMYVLIKEGDVLGGILSQGSWLLFLPGLILFALQKVGVIESQIPFYIMAVGALLVMYSASRAQKNIFLKPFAGIYGLYDIIGYFSDTMSYARLLALGLASAIIGVVINKIAQLVVEMIPIFGWAFLPAILLVGHVFNLTINALGSFIHSGRLQFVEFFTKFFEGGGKPFRPLTRVSENVFVNKT